jgi:hypothetical protein
MLRTVREARWIALRIASSQLVLDEPVSSTDL